MSNASRRTALKTAAGAWLGGTLSAEQAQHVHHQAEAAKQAAPQGVYKPKLFNDAEWKTLRRLCDLIIPKDDVSAGALEAAAPEFIDLLCSGNKRLSNIFTGGLGWLDAESRRRNGKAFLEAAPNEQTALLDLLAYRKNSTPELAPGIQFFDWVRRMTVDGFYTSRIGFDDLGFKGNKGMAKFQIPVEALEYALKRSPV